MSVLVAACGKTQKQVYADAKPAADVLRAKLVTAAKLVDAEPAPAASAACASPKKLTFDPSSDAHDTDFMMLQEAKRGGAAATDDAKDESLNLYFATNPFARVMRGTAGFYADYMLRDTAQDDFTDGVKRGLKVQNVVLVRERAQNLDYFLVDLAPAKPSIVCRGTFTPSGDPSLEGQHTEQWLVITKNRRTGKEISRRIENKETDPAKNALYKDATAQLGLRMHKELGLDGIE
ncbi:MAG: hypothetical protein QM723_17195 [Myxococcaceae bacterium]